MNPVVSIFFADFLTGLGIGLGIAAGTSVVVLFLAVTQRWWAK